MQMLHSASQIQLEDDTEYLDILHTSILEGYSGVIQALRDGDKTEARGQPQFTALLEPYLNNIVFLLEKKVAPDQNKDPGVLTAAINLLGDLAQAVPRAKPVFAQQPWVTALLADAFENDEVDNANVEFGRTILH